MPLILRYCIQHAILQFTNRDRSWFVATGTSNYMRWIVRHMACPDGSHNASACKMRFRFTEDSSVNSASRCIRTLSYSPLLIQRPRMQEILDSPRFAFRRSFRTRTHPAAHYFSYNGGVFLLRRVICTFRLDLLKKHLGHGRR